VNPDGSTQGKRVTKKIRVETIGAKDVFSSIVVKDRYTRLNALSRRKGRLEEKNYSALSSFFSIV
jgi:hypothetical protein